MALSEVSSLERCLDPTLWVVTARAGGARGGLLATFVSMASIARGMPRVAVGISKRHRTWELIESSGAFALHVLGEGPGHLALASRFGLDSGRTTDKLADLGYREGATGSPVLDDVAGWLDCRVEARFDTGDRTLYLAEVVDARAPDDDVVLTVQRWVRHLTPVQRVRLGEQYEADAAADAEAIRTWRLARTPGMT